MKTEYKGRKIRIPGVSNIINSIDNDNKIKRIESRKAENVKEYRETPQAQMHRDIVEYIILGNPNERIEILIKEKYKDLDCLEYVPGYINDKRKKLNQIAKKLRKELAGGKTFDDVIDKFDSMTYSNYRSFLRLLSMNLNNFPDTDNKDKDKNHSES